MNTTPYEDDTKFNKQMQSYADAIYQRLWKVKELHRDLGGLDKDRGIDVIVETNSGFPIALQEKFRRNKFKKYWQFTIEFMNNPQQGEKGELYKIAANYYFYGYAKRTEEGFFRWWIIDLNKFKQAYEEGKISPNGEEQNIKRSHASFLCFDWSKLRDFIAFQSNGDQTALWEKSNA